MLLTNHYDTSGYNIPAKDELISIKLIEYILK